MTYTLHGYQELARDFLRGQGRGLFLDMGLGKTASTLSALEPRHLPALVVAPKRVTEHVWPRERDLWRPDLDMAVAKGEPKQRAKQLDRNADVTVISKDNINDLLGRKPYKTVILDELSVYKGRAARWKTAKRLTDKADTVWGLTGTPAPNGYLDLWPQVYLLDKGQRLGKHVGPYREKWFKVGWTLPNGVVAEYEIRPGAEEEIRARIEDICLYMSAADHLQLPPVTLNQVDVQLPPAARQHYATMKSDLVLDLELLGLEVYSASQAAVLSGKLAQITAGFIFSDAQDGTYTWLHEAKLQALSEVVAGTGDNLLVFYNFIPERERIKAAFPQARTLDEPGAIDDWMDGKVPMLLCHPASAGHGLNLQSGGHTAVWTAPTWDLELWQQANGRLQRQGQPDPVVIHVLVAEGTVDESMMARLDTKKVTQDGLLDHLRSPM